ncbi:MAG: hypothetical protein HY923_04195 [Elusimicrobia bacterium]|nr:hypothetical protein [Elusimicrobiota bacterium]
MDSVLISRGLRALAALSAAAALLWAYTRYEAGSPPPVVPAAAPAPSKETAPKAAAAEPVQPPKQRSGLSDEGEALGGTPPKRAGGR